MWIHETSIVDNVALSPERALTPATIAMFLARNTFADILPTFYFFLFFTFWNKMHPRR